MACVEGWNWASRGLHCFDFKGDWGEDIINTKATDSDVVVKNFLAMLSQIAPVSLRIHATQFISHSAQWVVSLCTVDILVEMSTGNRWELSSWNCKISGDVEEMQEMNLAIGWIPGKHGVRPTPDMRQLRDELEERILPCYLTRGIFQLWIG